jgi:hypothetical protein
MATASRTRQPTRPASAADRSRPEASTLATWGVPAVVAVVFGLCAAASSTELVPSGEALAGGILALAVLIVFLGLRPLAAPRTPVRDRAIGALVGLVVLIVLYFPFHARIFPGTPLVEQAHVSASGDGLPVRIPAAGHAAIDVLLEGKLAPSPTGGTAPPVQFTLTLDRGDGDVQVVDGTFEDQLMTQRLGRRGTAIVHNMRNAQMRVVSNPRRADMAITKVAIDPPTAEALTVSVYAHPLPGPVVLALATAALLAMVVTFDRRGPIPDADGTLTLGTSAALGTALALWTSNTIHPDFRALIGSAMLGGLPGFGVGSLLWWIAKRLIDRPT